MQYFEKLGIRIPDILLPSKKIDLYRWAVIACDQFTSEPDYWDQVAVIVGNSPSTYHMILPEIYLNSTKEHEKLIGIRKCMKQYLEEGLLESYKGLILLERSMGGEKRHGVMLALDLEKYDYSNGSQSLIRATETTILERLPPRIKIRDGAPLEIPHILILIDDPNNTVIEPLFHDDKKLIKVYDFDLMLGSGHLKGFFSDHKKHMDTFFNALNKLNDPTSFKKKYALETATPTLLFAVGDGNHSLATAKAIWESRKKEFYLDHPSRYALVEIENIHDPGLTFLPIHRILFCVNEDLIRGLTNFYGSLIHIQSVQHQATMKSMVINKRNDQQVFGLITKNDFLVVQFLKPTHALTVGSLQPFLDEWIREKKADRIDYVHGDTTVFNLGRIKGNAGFYLPAMKKTELFRTVIIEGVLPKKTFSMGEAKEKRFYLESRKIT